LKTSIRKTRVVWLSLCRAL